MADMSAKQMRKMADLTITLNSHFKELAKTMKSFGSSKAFKEAAGDADKVTKKVENLNDAVENLSGGFSHLKNMWKASPAQLGKAAAAASKWSDEMKSAVSAAGNMKGAMGAAAKAAGFLGGVVGGISKALTGMPGLVLMGIKAVIDTAMKIDTYVKNMNKDFARVRGPQIMNKNVKQQFKDFNTAVTSIGDNLRDGLQVAEVKNFMENMTAAGMRIGVLNEGFYSYRDAVHIAAKASKVFGTDMVAVAGMMGKLMVDYKMNLDDVDDSFVQVAFDAEKSGLSTDRFWTAVQNASASLSFYGSFIKGVSQSIKTFSETQVTGAQETTDAVTQMTQLFAKNTDQANLAFIRMLGKGGVSLSALSDKFKEVADVYAGKAGAVELKIAASQDAVEIEALRKEQKGYNQLALRAQEAATGDQLKMAQNMGMLSDQAPDLLLNLLKSVNGANLSTARSGESLEAIIKGVESLTGGQISQELVKQIFYGVQGTAQGIVNAVKSIDDLSKVDANILGAAKENSTPEQLEQISSQLQLQTGIDKFQADNIVKAAAADEVFKTTFNELVTKAQEGNLSNEEISGALTNLLKKSDVGTKVLQRSYRKSDVSDKKMTDAYDDTFEKVRSQTLSMEDMKNIAKDGAKWQLALVTGVVDISVGVSRIVELLDKDNKGGGKTPAQQKNIELALSALKNEFPGIAKKLDKMDSGAVVQELSAGIKAQTEKLDALKYVSDALDKLYTSKSPETDVGKLITDLEAKTKTKEGVTEGEKSLLMVLKRLPTGQNFKEGLKTEKKDNAEKARDASKIIEKNTKAVSYLTTIDDKAGTTAELMDAMVAGEMAGKPESVKAVVDMLKSKYGSRMRVEALDKIPAIKQQIFSLAKNTKEGLQASGGIINLENISNALGTSMESAGPKPPAGPTPSIWSPKNLTSPAGVSPAAPSEWHQGLQRPLTVTSPGSVILHPKETILPASYGDFRSTPLMKEMPGLSAAVGGGGRGDISITVNATEKDLAQKIANEVRAVLYKQQVTGMG